MHDIHSLKDFINVLKALREKVESGDAQGIDYATLAEKMQFQSVKRPSYREPTAQIAPLFRVLQQALPVEEQRHAWYMVRVEGQRTADVSEIYARTQRRVQQWCREGDDLVRLHLENIGWIEVGEAKCAKPRMSRRAFSR